MNLRVKKKLHDFCDRVSFMVLETEGKIDPVNSQILRLKYENRRLSCAQIGRLIDPPMSAQGVHQRMVSGQIKQAIVRLDEDVITAIKNLQIRAVNVVEKSLETSDLKLALSAAKLILEPILQNSSQLVPETPVDQELIFEITEAPTA